MRKDIREGVVWYIMNNIEPNFTAMARQFDCDYRTVKAAYLEGMNRPNDTLGQTTSLRPSILDD